MSKDDFLDETFVADFLRLKVITLRKKRYNDTDHPPFVKIGARVFYPKKPFFAWVDKHMVGV